uniref:Putative secreted protein n=1 Tax=Anopheles darlingi TaxID=43151 RepID=A0A2M4D6E9_ANODA
MKAGLLIVTFEVVVLSQTNLLTGTAWGMVQNPPHCCRYAREPTKTMREVAPGGPPPDKPTPGSPQRPWGK